MVTGKLVQGQSAAHLRALSAIAQIVQDPNFERKWLRARGENGLRNVVISGKRMRQG